MLLPGDDFVVMDAAVAGVIAVEAGEGTDSEPHHRAVDGDHDREARNEQPGHDAEVGGAHGKQRHGQLLDYRVGPTNTALCAAVSCPPSSRTTNSMGCDPEGARS